MATYKVSPGTQVLHRGTLHPAGDTFTAEAVEVADMVKAGWLVEVPAKKAKKVASKGV